MNGMDRLDRRGLVPFLLMAFATCWRCWPGALAARHRHGPAAAAPAGGAPVARWRNPRRRAPGGLAGWAAGSRQHQRAPAVPPCAAAQAGRGRANCCRSKTAVAANDRGHAGRCSSSRETSARHDGLRLENRSASRLSNRRPELTATASTVARCVEQDHPQWHRVRIACSQRCSLAGARARLRHHAGAAGFPERRPLERGHRDGRQRQLPGQHGDRPAWGVPRHGFLRTAPSATKYGLPPTCGRRRF